MVDPFPMRVAAARITLDFYNNSSIPKKHAMLEKLCADVRKQFQVSAGEIADFEDPEKCVIGFAQVIPDSWNTLGVRALIEKLCRYIDENSEARVMTEETEILYLERDSEGS